MPDWQPADEKGCHGNMNDVNDVNDVNDINDIKVHRDGY